MQKWLVVAMCSTTSAMLAATVTLNGETEYSVAENTTNTVSDTLTGSGSIRKTGTGSLLLSGAGNDFTGGVVVEAGTVQADAAEAFGTGTITVPAEMPKPVSTSRPRRPATTSSSPTRSPLRVPKMSAFPGPRATDATVLSSTRTRT